MSACISVQRLALLRRWRRAPTRPPLVDRVAALAHCVGGAADAPRTACRDRARCRRRAPCTSVEEVRPQPRHAGELRPVRHLVQRDPEPEVARPERVALLEAEHVRADVVDARRRWRRRRRRARAGRTGRARAARRSRAASRARCRRPGDRRRERVVRHALGEPVAERLEQAAHRRDVGRTQPARSTTSATAGAGAAQPGVARRPRPRPDGDRGEVGVQRRGEVRVGERLAAGDAAGDPLGQTPSRPARVATRFAAATSGRASSRSVTTPSLLQAVHLEVVAERHARRSTTHRALEDQHEGDPVVPGLRVGELRAAAGGRRARAARRRPRMRTRRGQLGHAVPRSCTGAVRIGTSTTLAAVAAGATRNRSSESDSSGGLRRGRGPRRSGGGAPPGPRREHGMAITRRISISKSKPSAHGGHSSRWRRDRPPLPDGELTIEVVVHAVDRACRSPSSSLSRSDLSAAGSTRSGPAHVPRRDPTTASAAAFFPDAADS